MKGLTVDIIIGFVDCLWRGGDESEGRGDGQETPRRASRHHHDIMPVITSILNKKAQLKIIACNLLDN